MIVKPHVLLQSLAVAFTGMLIFAGNVIAETKAPRIVTQASKPFVVFDNMFYARKPDFSAAGLVRSCVIYPHSDWKSAIAAGKFPDEASFKKAVQDRAAGCSGPVVIDIEYVYLSRTHQTTDAQVKNHFQLFITLAKWAHEAAPGHMVGYYGHGLFPEEPGAEYAAETKELIAAVDAFFPSLYTFGNKTPAQWKQKLQSLAAKAHTIAPGKPVYPYLWAQYHEGAPKALEYLDGDYMKFQLETARDCGADGVVMWSSSRATWKDGPWSKALLKFVADKPVCRSTVKFGQGSTGKFDTE